MFFSRRVVASILCLMLVLNAIAADNVEIPKQGASIEKAEGSQQQLSRAKRLSKTVKYALLGAGAGLVAAKLHSSYTKSQAKKKAAQESSQGETSSSS